MVSQTRAKYSAVPILVGGSVTSGNFAEAMTNASGAIVSTAMKGSGSAVGRFVPEKVKEFMTAAREAH
jgi:predicted TIM-barrel enzyme